MIDVIRVAKSVKSLLDESGNEATGYIPTVSVACAELSERLVKAEYADDERVISAAVFLSYYRILLRQILSGEVQTGFKAGDITVSQSPSLLIEKAAILRDDAFVSASSMLMDIDFVFRQV